MKRFLFIFTILLLILVLQQPVYAQYGNSSWKRYRVELFGGTGTNHFLGELGGGKEEGAGFMGLRDVDLQNTRPVFQVGMRYKLIRLIAVRTTLNYALIKGDDKFSGDLNRLNRNLSFRSSLFEFGTQFEFYVLHGSGKTYVSQVSGFLDKFSLYMYGGASLIHFNPKAYYENEWVALQPLGTEGQGIPCSGKAKYNRWAFAFPIGLGAKYELTRRIGLGVQIANRYTTTDYMDDASGSYYNNDRIRAYYGPVAAALADRHIDPETNQPSQTPYPHSTPFRGNPDFNDSYFFFVVNVHYKLRSSGRGLPKL